MTSGGVAKNPPSEFLALCRTSTALKWCCQQGFGVCACRTLFSGWGEMASTLAKQSKNISASRLVQGALNCDILWAGKVGKGLCFMQRHSSNVWSGADRPSESLCTWIKGEANEGRRLEGICYRLLSEEGQL